MKQLPSSRFRSAIFLSPDGPYHADRCLPLVQAVEQGEVRLEALARRGYPGRLLPTKMLPEVSTVGYWDAQRPQSWGLDWHRNEGIELTNLLRHNEQPVWAASPEIGRCFEQLAQMVGTLEPAKALTRLKLHLNELFVVLLETLRSRRPTLDTRLASSRRTVEMFLASLPDHLDRPWTLDRMAQECGLGRTRFADYCLMVTNVPPMEFLTNCRIEAARRLLTHHPHHSVTEVAFACGFSSSQYFSTVFRMKTGLTPREFRHRG